MAVKELTSHSPYVTLMNSASVGIVTGIVDFVKVTSDTADDEAVLKVTPIGETEKEIHVSSGDSLYGPFSKVETVSTTDAGTWVLIYERSKIVVN